MIVPLVSANLKCTGVGPESGSILRPLIGIFSQTAGPTCEFRANPVNVTSQPKALRPLNVVLPDGTPVQITGAAGRGRRSHSDAAQHIV